MLWQMLPVDLNIDLQARKCQGQAMPQQLYITDPEGCVHTTYPVKGIIYFVQVTKGPTIAIITLKLRKLKSGTMNSYAWLTKGNAEFHCQWKRLNWCLLILVHHILN